MSLRAKAQQAARREPLLIAWLLVFLVAEVTAVLAIQIIALVGWWAA